MNDPVAGDRAAVSTAGLLAARISVPRNVVYRRFPEETVVLDVNTGTYHTLPARAARMLEALERASSVGEAARALAGDGPARTLVENDMCALCEWLLERSLLEILAPRP